MYSFSVLISLLAIVIFQRILKKLSLSLLSGIIILFFALRIHRIVEMVSLVLVSGSFWSLLTTVFLIYLLSSIMEVSGDYEKFSKEMKNVFSRNVDSFVPALMGLMPMPGGALFTAPIVKNSLPDENPLKLAIRNYWFRHTIEFFWPIYPAFVLVSELSEISIDRISMGLFPVFAIAFLVGWVFFNGRQLPKISPPESFYNLVSLIPILGTGVLIFFFKIPGWQALLLNTVGYGIFRRKHFFQALKTILKKWDIIVVLFLVYLYKIAIDQHNVGEMISIEFTSWNLPPWLLLVFLPLIAGISTGITQAAVGISLPVILGIFDEKSALYTYMFAVGGVILSPVHLCVVLSAKYFAVDVFSILKRVSLPLIITLVLGTLVLEAVT
ncbi:TIGR00529 family membrane protein [Thermotoga sp. KOL6]|uniref:TIGR00529 family membrane protein n=1 Tax=Thermotoga sp. KOL6 TaxID=126741 RepID=UPI000C789165|nr:TIGR00529 family membrane protein [Thermotoga sp. KOL6]PLV59206.1 hypothetical protein AS005_05525 [Thermotoga sp. KOL6]